MPVLLRGGAGCAGACAAVGIHGEQTVVNEHVPRVRLEAIVIAGTAGDSRLSGRAFEAGA